MEIVLDIQVRLKERAERINQRTKRMAIDIWENGKDFYEAQQELAQYRYGNFQEWVESSTGYSYQTAYRLIHVYQNFNYDNLSQLNVSTSILYLLASPSTPESAKQEIIEQSQNGTTPTVEETKQVIEEHKEAQQEEKVANGQEDKKLSKPREKSTPKTKPGLYTLESWNNLTTKEKHSILSNPPQTGARFNKQNEQDEDEEGIEESKGNIEWALWSWNPITGCLHNCPYCYARDIATRFYKEDLPDDPFQPVLRPNRLLSPSNTKQPDLSQVTDPIKRMGMQNVFTCSMADLFGKWTPQEWIEAILEQVRNNPQWTFLFLTKFPIRMAEFEYPSNVWLGTTVDKAHAVERAEKAFRKIKQSGFSGVCWLSCEPMLERLTFTTLEMFDWVVIGGSSKSTQTPEFKPPREWVNELEEQASKHGVKFYEKSNLLERIREYPLTNQ